MKMSSFNTRWSVLLVLFAGTMLLIAGCSSPTGSTTGSDTGGGASTITITGIEPEDASDFDGEYTVSGIEFTASPSTTTYHFCLAGQVGPNSLSRVVWEFKNDGTSWVYPQINGPGDFFPRNTHQDNPGTETTAPSSPPRAAVGENMNFEGSATTVRLGKGDAQTNHGFNFEFDINEMPVTESSTPLRCS